MKACKFYENVRYESGYAAKDMNVDMREKSVNLVEREMLLLFRLHATNQLDTSQ